VTNFVQLSQLPAIHALGWTLLHFLWQGTAVAILLACALRLLSGRSPQIRYVSACCALTLMMIMPFVTWKYLAAAPQIQPTTSAQTETNPGLSSQNRPIAAAQPRLDQITTGLDRSMTWIVAVWLFGVILLFSRMSLGLIVAQRMKTLAVESVPEELRLVFDGVCQRLRVTRSTQLYNSAVVQVPVVIGWLQPVILLPVGCLIGLSASQVEALLAHELAHIRRHDYLVNVFQSIVETFLFYHPATWWISEQIRREREYCCDDLAIGISGDPLAYAKALSFLEERRSSGFTPALGANGGSLVMRIRRVLGCKEPPAVSRMAAIILSAATLLTVGLCVGAVTRQQSTQTVQRADQNNDSLASLQTPYRIWLEYDVAYIITTAERTAYLKLSNNEEREHFIEDFWERRNPIPGSTENKFKEEHFRRIAYANEHFTAGNPGWKADRGRIYIVFGPPDDIKVQAGNSGDNSAKPAEIWHYRLIQEYAVPEKVQGKQSEKKPEPTTYLKNVDLKFVDDCRCGDYRLQSSPKK
jgi:GWxTD domain-containing protein